MQQLSMTDAFMFSVENDKQRLQMASVTILAKPEKGQQPVTRKVLRELVAQRVHLAPALLRKLVTVPLGLDHPYWVNDDALDLDYHVKAVGVPAPGSNAELSELVADLVTQPFDRARPLWQLHVVEGLANGRTAIVFKLHHAAVDGISALELHAMLFDTAPEGRAVAPPADPLGERTPTQAEMLTRGLTSLAYQPMLSMLGSAVSMPYLDQIMPFRVTPGIGAMAKMARLGRLDGPKTPLEGAELKPPKTVLDHPLTSARRRWSFTSVPLADAKRVKDRFGLSINDVVVATMAGVARELLLELKDLPAEPLVALVPVSVRSEEDGACGNLVQVMLVELPTDDADPERRLRRTHEALRDAKERHGAVPAHALQAANGVLMPAFFALASKAAAALSKTAGLTSNLVVSNMPGPPVPVYVAGSEVEALYPFGGVIEGFGYGTIVFSYRGRLSLGFTIADNSPLDPWHIAELYERNHCNLLGLVA